MTEPLTIESVRKQLQTALRSEPLDFDAVTHLALELSSLDPEYARFSVDAAHISRLGLELVAKQQTAVAELVKNSYDADAVEVRVTFRDAEEPGGEIELWDNGTGMSREELIAGYMRLSTAAKIAEPTSLGFKRRRAGRKGIGRFAAQRLGRRLTVTTQTVNAPQALRLSIDWTAFSSGTDLQSVRNRVETAPSRETHGTTLTISGLRDGWSDAEMRASYQSIVELVQPFPLDRTATEPHVDPGFHVTFTRQGGSEPVVISDPWTEYFQYALAEIDGRVDDGGKPRYHLRSHRYSINQYDRPKERYKLLTGVRFRVFYFIPTEVPRQSRAVVSNKLRSSGGIRVYRNGFRTLPYGEPFDDWLGLDSSSRRRLVLPPHANTNFLGFVEITDASGERFEETSSREGLVENSAYRELQLFIQRGLIALALRVASARGKKLHAGGPRKLRSGMEVAEQIVSSLGANLDSDTANDIRRLGEASDELERELRMMRVLATLGLTLAEFTHEVALGFTALGADVENLRDQIESNPEAARLAARVERHVSSLQSYIDYFENTARDNVSAEVQPLDVGDAVREFEELCAARNARQHIKMNIHLKHHVLRVRPMHVSELSSILTNLYTNAAKAIRTARVAGQIDISVRREANAVVMEFSDNGCGVKEANRELIFEPFFTTTSDHDVYASDADHVRGMGLGLKIVRDIVESNGGTINLSHAKRGYTTTFRIDLPEANANVS